MTRNYINKKISKRGFTLIELLVVISIIGVLATVVLSSLNDAREKAREGVVFSEVRSLRTALELYYLDNGSYPVVPSNASWSWFTGLCEGQGSPGYEEFREAMDGYINNELINNQECIYYSSYTNTGYSGPSNWLCDYVVFGQGQGYVLTWYSMNIQEEPWYSGRTFGAPFGHEHCATHIR
ncbi:MAG: prepilin-type N-terminal cleavage/methylation domain-containing protein [Candidatus Pacebacteria bacterium]|nr:prepilin-type N-terminal cleavage/methylation domain-containing protein [Candidatus Paceibacterota bacterium]